MCSFSYAGCPGKFLREDEEKHMEENSKEHLSLIAAITLQMSLMLDKVAVENEEIKKKLLKQEEELKKNQQEELKKIMEEMGEKERKLDQLKEELKEIKEKQEVESKKIQEEMGEKERKLNHLKATIKKLLKQEAEMGKEIATVEEKCQYLERALKQYESECDVKFTNMEDNVAELQNNISNSYALPVIFTVPYFNRLKLSDQIWYSKTLQTHFQGYTFSIAVRPNAVFGHIKYVGLLYKSQPGEYDDTLDWPSNREITIQLLNQHADKNHMTKRVFITRTTKKDDRLLSINNYFISHDKLGWNGAKETQYLKNDCLKFKILKC